MSTSSILNSYALDGSDSPDLGMVKVDDHRFVHCATLTLDKELSFGGAAKHAIVNDVFTSTVWIKRVGENSAFSFLDGAGFSCDGNGQISLLWQPLTDVEPLSFDVWYHMGLVRTIDEVALYINGERVADLKLPVPWLRSSRYDVGDRVLFGSAIYRAKWGAQGESPDIINDEPSSPWELDEDPQLVQWQADLAGNIADFSYQGKGGNVYFAFQNFYSVALGATAIATDFYAKAVKRYMLNGDDDSITIVSATDADDRFSPCAFLDGDNELKFGSAIVNGLASDTFTATVWVKRGGEGSCFNFLDAAAGFSCDQDGRLSLLWQPLVNVGVLPLGVWYHLALVKVEDGASLYINSKRVANLRMPTEWSSSDRYDVADVVVFNQQLYRARWSTKAESPDGHNASDCSWLLLDNSQLLQWQDKSANEFNVISYKVGAGEVCFSTQNFYSVALKEKDIFADFYVKSCHHSVRLAKDHS